MISFLSTVVFANESVHLAAGFNIYRCSEGNCPTPISEVSPLIIELEGGPDSLAWLGSTELSETRNEIQFSATIQVVKILSGPNKGYLVQAFISAFKNGDYLTTKQNGFVLVEDLSKLNRIDWQDQVNDGEITYIPVISIGPAN